MMDKPIKVSAVLKITAEFYDPEATPETVRACVEQDLEDAGFDVEVVPFDKGNNSPVKWVPVKKRLPDEHPSIFAPWYGTAKWNEAMWRTESDRVLVAIKFSDGTRTVDKGKLQEGKWRTGVSPVIPQEVTHWALWPEPPKEKG